MFSRWIITNNTCARRTLHCRKTRISCGDQLEICRQYTKQTSFANCAFNAAPPGYFWLFVFESYIEVLTHIITCHMRTSWIYIQHHHPYLISFEVTLLKLSAYIMRQQTIQGPAAEYDGLGLAVL
jgi:hypothetical protein